MSVMLPADRLLKMQEGWLFFGITNEKVIKGTVYRKDGGLQV